MLLSTTYGVSGKGKWIKINKKMSHQTIGELLGINRNTVGIVIKELMDKELIVQINGYYNIRNSTCSEKS
jgi:predicted HTH transcriptional regulator